VGARTASGSNLMAQVFHPDSYSRLKLAVTALELTSGLEKTARRLYPDVAYRVGDVMKLTERFDVVTCSHVLEHVADPGAMLDHLRAIARRLVVVAAPYRERLDPAKPNTSRHLHSFDEQFFATRVPRRLSVFSSPHWSGSECFVAVYDPLS
jgi:hypothetical protein